jgi:hypothetical protein
MLENWGPHSLVALCFLAAEGPLVAGNGYDRTQGTALS